MNDLFAEFTTTSKEDWKAQATKDLRRKDFLSTLSSRLWDKINLEPIYTLEDIAGKISDQVSPNPEPEYAGGSPRFWSNMVSIFPEDSNEDILRQLETGAEGLVLNLTGFEELDSLLRAVKPEYIPILIKPIGNPIAVLQNFLDWVGGQLENPEQLKGSLLWSPSDLVFEKGQDFGLGLEIAQELLEISEPYPNFKVISLNSSRYTESGANPLDALVFSMGELIEILDVLEFPAEKIFQKVLLQGGSGDHHFGEIARLKAFRKGLCQLAELYSIDLNASDQVLLFQSPDWSKSILDANNNLIRQSYEAISGVLGGANLLWMRAFQEEKSSELEKRMAKNVSLILKEESYLDKVVDPTAGSFFLEKLEEMILEEVRDGLERLESMGGFSEALNSGYVHSEVRKNRQKSQLDLVEKASIKVGVNEFLVTETSKHTVGFDFFEENSFQLNPTRAAYMSELQILTNS